jgi:hypothetical protein
MPLTVSRRAFLALPLLAAACRKQGAGALLADAPAPEITAFPTVKAHDEDFFYAQQTCFWTFFRTPLAAIQGSVGPLLEGLALTPVAFETSDYGYVVLKAMAFTGEFGRQTADIPGLGPSSEIELCLLVRPAGAGGDAGNFADFLRGKRRPAGVGQLRLDVVCDDEIAVSAGRTKFGEHKYLGSFELDYPTANAVTGSMPAFSMTVAVSTFHGAGKAESLIVKFRADTAGLTAEPAAFSPELLYAAFPPEPAAGQKQQAIREQRLYNAPFKAFLGKTGFSMELGAAGGAAALSPKAPFGDGKAIAGSETWPGQLRDRLKALTAADAVAGYLLFQPAPVEYETKPIPV